MLVDRPQEPKGYHVLLLRTQLDITQTFFGALMDTAQTTVSHWEHPDKRDTPLPPTLAARFLEVWDCLPTPPAGGFAEMMARVGAYRLQKAGVSTPGANAASALIRLVPESGGRDGAPKVYWAPEDAAPGGEQPTSPSGAGPVSSASPLDGSAPQGPGAAPAEPGQPRSVFRAQMTFLTLSVLFAVFHARHRSGQPIGSASTERARVGFNRWAMAVALLGLVMPTGCFLGPREELRGAAPFMAVLAPQTSQMGQRPLAERYIPNDPLPGQKLAPCDPEGGEKGINRGCWVGLSDVRPPCGRKLYRYGDTCYRPVAADPKQPVSDAPSSSNADKACHSVSGEEIAPAVCR